MIREFSQNRNKIILNFSLKYCAKESDVLSSEAFEAVLSKYMKKLKKANTPFLENFESTAGGEEKLTKSLMDIFKLLLVLSLKEIKAMNPVYEGLLCDKEQMISFIEGLYGYWRRHERYALIHANKKMNGIQNVTFIDEINNFTNLILQIYRTIEEKINEHRHNVYRQLPAGVNAGLVLYPMIWNMPKAYEAIRRIMYIDTITIRPPFITYPEKNTRDGFFKEVFENPIEGVSLDPTDYFCYPAKVGSSLAYVYFHRDLMSHGVSLCNLFELAKHEEYMGKKPDIVYLFGANINCDTDTCFYHDTINNIYVGAAKNTTEVDYFGYMKKMILTLYNIKMINEGNLPIHGAMVNITLKNGKEANVVIIGDSGAGKSESLEAFRILSEDYLKDIKIIFDDMGTFKIEKNRVVGYGTEIGAFVRLDDLDISYAYNEMDRAIFMNPDKINARLIMPVSTYNEIMHGYPVDIVLYANNYVDSENVLEHFDSKEAGIAVFKTGARRAKGTTTETGIVESYFANPFGPYQRQEKTDILLEQYFETLSATKVPTGIIYTKLAIDGKEQDGPMAAAKGLFKWITENK